MLTATAGLEPRVRGETLNRQVWRPPYSPVIAEIVELTTPEKEEIRLSLTPLEKYFLFRVRLGFSYRFGSKVANIVNPRLRD